MYLNLSTHHFPNSFQTFVLLRAWGREKTKRERLNLWNEKEADSK